MGMLAPFLAYVIQVGEWYPLRHLLGCRGLSDKDAQELPRTHNKNARITP